MYIASKVFLPLSLYIYILKILNIYVAVGCIFLHDVISKLNQWGFHIPVFVSWDECIFELERKISLNADLIIIYCSFVCMVL